jgi:hypothetical protein
MQVTWLAIQVTWLAHTIYMAGYTSYMAGYVNYIAFGGHCVLGPSVLCAGSLPAHCADLSAGALLVKQL